MEGKYFMVSPQYAYADYWFVLSITFVFYLFICEKYKGIDKIIARWTHLLNINLINFLLTSLK